MSRIIGHSAGPFIWRHADGLCVRAYLRHFYHQNIQFYFHNSARRCRTYAQRRLF